MRNHQSRAVFPHLGSNSAQLENQTVGYLLKGRSARCQQCPWRIAPGLVCLRILFSDIAPGHIFPNAGGYFSQQNADMDGQFLFPGNGIDRHHRAVGITGINSVNMYTCKAAAQHFVLFIALGRHQSVHMCLRSSAGIPFRFAVPYQINIRHSSLPSSPRFAAPMLLRFVSLRSIAPADNITNFYADNVESFTIPEC